RLSNAMFNAILDEPTHNIDLHCWQIARATTVLARSDVEMSIELAGASAVRFGRRRPGRKKETEGPKFPCVLTAYYNDSGRSAICIELSGQNVIVEREVLCGLRAVVNCFKLLELLPGEPEGTEEDQLWLDENEEVTVEAPCSGLYVRNPDLDTSDPVGEGHLLGHILGFSDLKTMEVRSPATGYLYSFAGNMEERKPKPKHTDHPYVDTGQPVAQIIRP
ncbi:MAG: succinylglutamate desuccinylase/aspartoacylase family protein, partial [Candidatus Latescibacteria bacterium]|nr:succinylglutamate desuccinylase/aspartoacylase family protein [Candidatus Latescibacterota bacterium]